MLASICETTTLPVVYYGTQPCVPIVPNIQTDGMKTTFTVHTPTYISKVTLPVWACIMY